MSSASKREHEILSGVQLASGILYVALFFSAAASISVMAVSIEFSRSPVDAVVARQFPQYGATLLIAFAMRTAAMFVFTTSRLSRLENTLPRWFAAAGFAVGLFLFLSPSFNRALVLVFPLWLGEMPALLKAFFEQVARPGFAYDLGGSPLRSGLLRGKSARIVITMGMPAFVYRLYYGSHSLKAMKIGILRFMGIAPIRSTLIGMVGSKRFDGGSWLDEMLRLGRMAR